MKGLLKRLLPAHESLFRFELGSAQEEEEDTFTVASSSAPGGDHAKLVITVRATSGVALASGLYWYLQNKCNSSISW